MPYRTERGAPLLETKYAAFHEAPSVSEEGLIEGYASVFGLIDQGGDTVAPGAFKASLAGSDGRAPAVKFLWQHDPTRPIGIWTSLVEDEVGLRVRGRFLTDVQAGAEALSLLRAGAVEGLSIGYRVRQAEKAGLGRRLTEIDLWEVSLVTFPMLPEARASAPSAAASQEAAKGADDNWARALAEAFTEASGR